jgi:hypothetical protein
LADRVSVKEIGNAKEEDFIEELNAVTQFFGENGNDEVGAPALFDQFLSLRELPLLLFVLVYPLFAILGIPFID